MSRRTFGIFKDILTKYRNRNANKEEVGQDMYGNKYFQIYDSENFPYKREVEYKEGYKNPQMDPIWVGWLKGTETKPPSSQEIQNSFEDYQKRKDVGNDYDKKDEEIMSKFREAMKKSARPIMKKEFEPKMWDPVSKGNKKY